jgi:hypothetical protein
MWALLNQLLLEALGDKFECIRLISVDGVEEHVHPGGAFADDTTTGVTNDDTKMDPVDVEVTELTKLNLVIYFNCACTKLIQTHKGRNRPGATIPSSCERGVMRTGYPTPSRRCMYCSMVRSAGMMRFSASSKYSLANSAQHFCPL